ncbi:MAG: NERD domain-containing protein [Caldisericia bacterium]|nr:NERD domain-containing protein [Caldisericia bacterium]
MKIIQKKDFVKNTLSSLHLKTFLLILLFFFGFCSIAYGLIQNVRLGITIFGCLLTIVSGYLIDQKLKQVNIWKAGLTGQESVENVLSLLSDEWNLINSFKIPHKNCDIDHLLVGPKGIFLLETKNYHGKIECVGDAWNYTKTGRNGGVYKGHINNPSKQLKRNVWELRKHLEKKINHLNSGKFPYWIQGILVFTNIHTELELQGETVVVLKTRQLISYLQKFHSEPLPKSDIDLIMKELK